MRDGADCPLPVCPPGFPPPVEVVASASGGGTLYLAEIMPVTLPDRLAEVTPGGSHFGGVVACPEAFLGPCRRVEVTTDVGRAGAAELVSTGNSFMVPAIRGGSLNASRFGGAYWSARPKTNHPAPAARTTIGKSMTAAISASTPADDRFCAGAYGGTAGRAPPQFPQKVSPGREAVPQLAQAAGPVEGAAPAMPG
jgi:hypothetical protein